MPKETVYGEQQVFDPANKRPMVPRAEVLWHRESATVQVVTKATDADGGRWAEYDENGESEHHITDGFYVDLDRQSINQLIRNLRRARDQAFGRDE